MNLVNTNYNSTEDMIDKLQQLNGKTKLKFYKNISIYYNDVKNKNFQTQQDPFAKDDNIDYNNFNDFITPNHKISFKPRETLLR